MREAKKQKKKLIFSFINPNSNEKFEELLKLVIIERIKTSNKFRPII